MPILRQVYPLVTAGEVRLDSDLLTSTSGNKRNMKNNILTEKCQGKTIEFYDNILPSSMMVPMDESTLKRFRSVLDPNPHRIGLRSSAKLISVLIYVIMPEYEFS